MGICMKGKDVSLTVEYIELPFMRMVPYKEGLNPFNKIHYPNEPSGYIKIPVVITSDMNKDDILLEAIKLRNILIDKWLKLGNCTK